MAAQDFWIGTSWKMNKTLAEAVVFAERLKKSESQAGIQRFVIPPYTSVREVSAILSGTDVKTGVQNMHWDDSGAWTGEISPLMVKDCGAEIVELGHSERRANFGETNRTVGLKVASAVRHGLIPLICVGETEDERESGRSIEVLKSQVQAALSIVSDGNRTAPILLAYEPVWAIGDGGTPATPEYADQRQAEIVSFARSLLGHRVPCLYGGSVNATNCQELIDSPNIDGLFIGRAAWDVAGYLNILALCAKQLERRTE